MQALLLRVGADGSHDGGGWNAPVDTRTRRFAYVPIPEARRVRAGMERPYDAYEEKVSEFGVALPSRLRYRNAHLDPDFERLTYGHGRKNAQLLCDATCGDLLVFYSSLRDVHRRRPLVYALIGLYVVDEIVAAGEVPLERYDENAHTRREPIDPTDVIARAQHGRSGRLERCLPVGEWRSGSYRVRPDISAAWGGIKRRGDFLVRAPRGIPIGDPEGFLTWFNAHDPTLVTKNN